MWLMDLIETLDGYAPETPVARGFGNPHSYRGYYDQLAFEPVSNTTTGDMLAAALSAVGATYEGYKGGSFEMNNYTDVWLAEYGRSGEALSALLVEYLIADGRTWDDSQPGEN